VGGLPTGTVNGFAVHPTNLRVMYVAMRDGVFRSDGAGESWARAASSPRNVATVAVSPRRPAEVYAATVDGRIYWSTDGGRRWMERRGR
jgi:photosystem II stability/assembly factor-like uncharacterized protein